MKLSTTTSTTSASTDRIVIDEKKEKHLKSLSKEEAVNINYMSLTPLYLSEVSEELEFVNYNTLSGLRVDKGMERLLSKMQFLNDHVVKEKTLVIYIGYASNLYVNALFELYPDMYWYLVDPVTPPNMYYLPNVTVVNGYFNDELVKDLGILFTITNTKRVLLLSDLRTCLEEKNFKDSVVLDSIIEKDMEDQKRWTTELSRSLSCGKSLYALLRFGVPKLEPQTLEYFSGSLYVPIYGKLDIRDYYLRVENIYTTKVYDIQSINRKGMYFTKNVRCAYYAYNYVKEQNIDHCFDCAARFDVFTKYVETTGRYSVALIKMLLLKYIDTSKPSVHHHISSKNSQQLLEYSQERMRALIGPLSHYTL